MNYLSKADRSIYNVVTNSSGRPLGKAEQTVAAIQRAHTTPISTAAATELQREIKSVFAYLEDRLNLAMDALYNKGKLEELLAFYPNVRAHALAGALPDKGLLGAAIAGVSEEDIAKAKVWFDKMVGAMSLIPKLKDYYLVYSGVGPNKAIIHRAAMIKEEALASQSNLLYGVAVHATAQKSFIELFNAKNNAALRLIQTFELHLDPSINGGTPLEINKRVLGGFLQNHNVLDFNYRGHKATFFTKL